MALIVHPAFPLEVVAPAPPKPRKGLDVLPANALHSIAGFLGAEDLLRYEQVCKSFRFAANDDGYWKALVLEKFGWHPPQEPPSWRALYRFQHEFFLKVVLRRATDTLMHMRLGALPRIPIAGFAPIYV